MKDEWFDIIDKNDKIVGKASWTEVYEKKLLHRTVRVFISNSNGELLLQQRGENVAHPNQWTNSAGGKVSIGETYEKAARRELKEELGIEIKLTFLFKNWDSNESLDSVFEGIYDGKIMPNLREVAKVEFVSIKKLKEELHQNTRDFTNGFKKVIVKYLEMKKLGGRARILEERFVF